MNESDKRKILDQWLFLADCHYLSARLGFMHGLYPVALHNGATAAEQYIKCILKLQDKNYRIGHRLKFGIKELNIITSPEVDNFLSELEKSYKNKYPDAWKEGQIYWKDSLVNFDYLVSELRNDIFLIVGKISDVTDLLKIVKEKGHISPDVSAKYGTMSLRDVLYRNNNYVNKFKLFFDKPSKN